MSKLNVQGLINNIPEKTSVYTPIVEAIVNSIEAIEQSSRSDGVVKIILKRSSQSPLGIEDDVLPRIKSVEIQDNGIGFTEINRESFDTVYSNQKVEFGGKGFGRFMYLKYFEKVTVESTYAEAGKHYKRSFTFSSKTANTQDFIENEKITEITTTELLTKVMLEDIKDVYSNRLDKKLETIARILVEKLLPFFINDKYKCPTISIKEANTDNEIILNKFFKEHDGIKQVDEEKVSIKKDSEVEEFVVKVFKIYFTQSPSSVVLTAHNRAVTTTPLYEYVPEFKDDFYDIQKNDSGIAKKNFSIKAYVLGDYLNSHVSLEREDFKFGRAANMFYSFSQQEIESKVASIVADKFKDEVISRQQKKWQKIKDYVDNVAPWHKPYINELDTMKVPYNFEEADLESEFQKLKFEKDISTRRKAAAILEGKEKDIAESVSKLSKDLTDLGKNDLAHYVVLRRVILDLLSKSLKWTQDKNYEKEKVLHDLIFPMRSDSDSVSYEEHNLWVLDERLSFHEYVASDKLLKTSSDRPDLLIFNKSIAVREGNETSNPITIFEFKRPQREDYTDDEDPIDQILKYVEKNRKGNFKDVTGRNIKANANTPAYGFLVCDITEKIKEFCKRYSLTLSPDEEGYFGYQNGYNVYLEVISFDKLVKDAEQRNKIFFKKLNIH